MTIGIGVLDKKQQKIYVAADTLVTYGSEFKRHAGSKFLTTETTALVVGAGSIRLSQIFNLLLKEQPGLLTFRSELDVVAIADLLYEKIAASGVGEAENNETPAHEFEFLLTNNLSNKIFVIEGDYSVEEFTDYACIGSGYVQAQAALRALYSVGVQGKEALEQAMRTVMDLHPHCGGQIETRELSLPSPELK